MMEIVKGADICSPKGYRASAVRAGFKRKRKDLCLVVSDVPAVMSVKFTKNLVKAAPLLLAMDDLKKNMGKLQAFVVNSGNANAGTGAEGYENARSTAAYAANELHLPAELVMVGSTGVIGHQLDMKKMMKGLEHCLKELSYEPGQGCAEAILTTDTVEKSFGMQLELGGKTVTFAGITKGSGMIAPNMATTLAYVTTDLAVDRELLDEIFSDCVDRTYNMITVDGHMSTNDTALILANGLAENAPIIRGSRDYEVLREGLYRLMLEMALSIVRDGEGATKFVSIRIEGAGSDRDARTMAFAIANSALVKTALFGEDPNWGRFLSAAGMTDAVFDPDHAELDVNGTCIFRNGEPVRLTDEVMHSLMKPKDVDIHLKFSEGSGQAAVYTSDLSYEYVKINAEYHT